MANKIGNSNVPLPTTRLPDQRLPNEQPRTPNDAKTPGNPGNLSANATGVFRLPDAPDQHGGAGGGDANGGGGGGSGGSAGGGLTAVAQAIQGLSDTGIQRVAGNVAEALVGPTPPTPEVGAVQDLLAGARTYGSGTLLRKEWDANFASTQGRAIRVSGDVPAAEAGQILAARTEAHLNARGPNPLVIARDRSGVS